MTHRVEQLESTLQRSIAEVLTAGLADPRVRGLISVTGVKLTADKRIAVVSISVMPAEVEPTTLNALHHAAAHIRREVSEKVRLRQMPHLQFKLDDTIKKQSQVIDAINQAMRATGGPQSATEGPRGETAPSDEVHQHGEQPS